MITKRNMMFGVPLILVGCATTPGGPTPADTAQADLGLLDAGLTSVYALLQALPVGQRPSDATLAQIKTQIDNFHSNLALLQAAAVPQETLKQVGAILSAIAGLATPFFPAAPFISMAINAALTMWPFISAQLNPAVPPAAGITVGPSVKMSVARARATLKAVSTP